MNIPSEATAIADLGAETERVEPIAWLERLNGIVGAIVEFPAAVLVLAEVVVLLMGVFWRYALHQPLIWSDELASILFHELSHQVVYIPDDSAFNEAFAVTVEREGLTRWLAYRGREAELGKYVVDNFLQPVDSGNPPNGALCGALGGCGQLGLLNMVGMWLGLTTFRVSRRRREVS